MKPKNVGRNKERDSNLHMDENDDISSPQGSTSTTSNPVVDDENSAYHNEEEEPKSKVSKRSKSTHRTKEDRDSKGNLISLRMDDSVTFL